MGKRTLAAVVAGGVLVGAGLVTSMVSAPAPAAARATTSEEEQGWGVIARGMDLLAGVVDDLVGEGTIDRDQADAVLTAVEDKAAEIRERRRALREEIRGYLEDGAIREEEAEGLPEGNWLLSEVFDEAWSDGELTMAEIREARPHPRRHAFRLGARLGLLLDDGGIDPQEYHALPEDHPLKIIDVSQYIGDGLITIGELREINGEILGWGNGG